MIWATFCPGCSRTPYSAGVCGSAGTTPDTIMILPHYSHLLAGLIPHARVKIYPDSAHGFLFQHHAEFAADVEAFLAGAS